MLTNDCMGSFLNSTLMFKNELEFNQTKRVQFNKSFQSKRLNSIVIFAEKTSVLQIYSARLRKIPRSWRYPFEWAIHGLFFFIFVFSTVNMFIMHFCRCLDTNRGPLVLDVTALPTEQQQVPKTLKSLKLANPGLFLFISFFSNTKFTGKNCSLKRDSNSDRGIIRQARWPLDHHHDLIPLKSLMPNSRCERLEPSQLPWPTSQSFACGWNLPTSKPQVSAVLAKYHIK